MRHFLGTLAISAAIIVAILFFSSVAPKTATPTTSQNNPPVAFSTPMPDYKLQGIKLVDFSWYKGGFGTVSMVHIQIKNLTKRSIGNIKYSARYFSDTGIESGSSGDKIITKIIKPGQTRSFDVNDGFIQSSHTDHLKIEITDYDFIN